MAKAIQITPTITAQVFTEEDLLSEEELQEVLRGIPSTTLEAYGIGADAEGDDTPEEARKAGLDYAEKLLSTVDRMKREGYTITNHADFYWFGHRKWSSRGGNPIRKLIPHHMAGNLTPRQFMAIMQSSRQMSPQISIHTDGTVYAWVPEEMRSWCTSGWEADRDSLTAEIANDEIGGTWHVSDKAYNLWCQIAAEWCKRYGIVPHYAPGRRGTIQMHKEWASTACPGPYLSNKITSGQMERDILAIMNPPAPKPAPAKKVSYLVQCGAFKNRKNATVLADKLRKLGFDVIIKETDTYFKVQCGAFAVKANADKLAAEIKRTGVKAIVLEV